MVFAGGRPALTAILLFLRQDITVKIAEAEYAGFYGILDKLKRRTEIVESNESNNFRPKNEAYMGQNKMCIFSNPCNPTGITKVGADLDDFVQRASQPGHGALIDEAYEMFHDKPESALRYVKNID